MCSPRSRSAAGDSPRPCTVEGCGRDTNAGGLCRAHAKRLQKYGDARADVPVKSVSGEGSINHGYRRVAVPKELRHLTGGEYQVFEHRLVMAQHLGRPLYPQEVVHHRNGNRTDNRVENLELWSTSQPKGQHVDDKVAFAVEMLRRYRPDLLAESN